MIKWMCPYCFWGGEDCLLMFDDGRIEGKRDGLELASSFNISAFSIFSERRSNIYFYYGTQEGEWCDKWTDQNQLNLLLNECID